VLKIIGVKEVKQEEVSADGYTLSVNWNNFYPSGHIYWRTGIFYSSLLEIGFNDADHTIKHIKLVTLSDQYVTKTPELDFNIAAFLLRRGIPVVDWTFDKPSPARVDETGEIYATLKGTEFTITIGENFTLKEVIVAERVWFGLDEQQILRAIRVADLKDAEQANIKLAFPGLR
jgi:hypothetical protein